jgi:hypothetical protein
VPSGRSIETNYAYDLLSIRDQARDVLVAELTIRNTLTLEAQTSACEPVPFANPEGTTQNYEVLAGDGLPCGEIHTIAYAAIAAATYPAGHIEIQVI